MVITEIKTLGSRIPVTLYFCDDNLLVLEKACSDKFEEPLKQIYNSLFFYQNLFNVTVL